MDCAIRNSDTLFEHRLPPNSGMILAQWYMHTRNRFYRIRVNIWVVGVTVALKL